MRIWLAHLGDWWNSLLHPEKAGRLVTGIDVSPGFFAFLTIEVILMYALYGVSMGIFRGQFPGLVSGMKMPFLYLSTQLICFPAFYVCNCRAGLLFSASQCARLLLIATSANAVALSSYAPLSFFFTLTTSHNGYSFLVFMHIVVFALSGAASLAVVALVVRAAAAAAGRTVRAQMVATWCVLYALVGSEMAWVLRPWIGWWSIPYTPFRPMQESFFESLFRVIRILFLGS